MTKSVRERHRQAARRRRRLTFVALLGGVATIALVTVAVRQYMIDGDVVLITDRAVSSATPSTLPTDAAMVDREAPRSVTIDDLELWGPVTEVGIEDDGSLEVPDEKHIGWYSGGSAPGLPGATVLAAHVTWNRTVGPFYRLGTLEPGARIEVRLDERRTRTYEVVERVMYPKDELPEDRIWTTTGDESLVLITCGGSYNPEIRRYRHNIVVYAVPISAADRTTPDLSDITTTTGAARA